MSLKQEIETWVRAINAYEAKNYDESLQIFGEINDQSKILFNCGMIYATMGKHHEAIDQFKRAVALDQYLAIAYFQEGVCLFLLGDFEEALANFNDALLYMRGNTFIDYAQLGLAFKLFSAEILFNRGLCYIYLQQSAAGMEDLKHAQKEKLAPEHDVIDDAIRDYAEGYTVFSVPIGVIYRPNSAKVKNLATKDYLGRAILVASSNTKNTHTDFDGAVKQQVATPKNDVSTPRRRSLEEKPLAPLPLPPIRRDLPSRSRQQSEPPINRNMFPPTPPPEEPAQKGRYSPDTYAQRELSPKTINRTPERIDRTMQYSQQPRPFPGGDIRNATASPPPKPASPAPYAASRSLRQNSGHSPQRNGQQSESARIRPEFSKPSYGQQPEAQYSSQDKSVYSPPPPVAKPVLGTVRTASEPPRGIVSRYNSDRSRNDDYDDRRRGAPRNSPPSRRFSGEVHEEPLQEEEEHQDRHYRQAEQKKPSLNDIESRGPSSKAGSDGRKSDTSDLYDLYRDTARGNPYTQQARNSPRSFDKPQPQSKPTLQRIPTTDEPVPYVTVSPVSTVGPLDQVYSPSQRIVSPMSHAGGPGLSMSPRDRSITAVMSESSRTQRSHPNTLTPSQSVSKRSEDSYDSRGFSSPAMSSSKSTTLRIKVHHGEEKRFVLLPAENSTFQLFVSKCEEKLQISGLRSQRVHIKDDGDFVTVADEDDWLIALEQWNRDEKMEVWIF